MQPCTSGMPARMHACVFVWMWVSVCICPVCFTVLKETPQCQSVNGFGCYVGRWSGLWHPQRQGRELCIWYFLEYFLAYLSQTAFGKGFSGSIVVQQGAVRELLAEAGGHLWLLTKGAGQICSLVDDHWGAFQSLASEAQNLDLNLLSCLTSTVTFRKLLQLCRSWFFHL